MHTRQIGTRSNKLVKNIVASVFYQISTIICGFVLPRLILGSYGSDVNGLVNSITQFLQVIAFLELGVGAVVQSSLYKPLAEHNDIEISKIISSASKFFRRIASILAVYIVILIVVYPFLANQQFGFIYTAGLIAVIGVSSFSQYYFGVVDRILLTADQRGYIQYTAQAITLILNTIACAILIQFRASIHVVKLTTSILFFARPLFLKIYVDRNYLIDRKIRYEGEPIKQKWNGVAQHVAAVVLDSTDTIILTFMSDLASVSVYSVYFLVVHGIKQLFMSLTNGFHSLIGELWAKQEKENLSLFFSFTEWFIHTGTVFLFGCTSVLIIPFVRIYTNGITDVNYIRPIFGYLLVAAHAFHCLRLPYNIMILAGGHYKQTQHNYIIAAVLNIVISVLAVKSFGLVGVAIGSLTAMMYQTIWMAFYNSKNLIKWPFIKFIKRMLVDSLMAVISLGLCSIIRLSPNTYLALIPVAILKAIIWAVVIFLINMLFYKGELALALNNLKHMK